MTHQATNALLHELMKQMHQRFDRLEQGLRETRGFLIDAAAPITPLKSASMCRDAELTELRERVARIERRLNITET